MAFTAQLSCVSRKSAKIAQLISEIPGARFDPHYLGFFNCFNCQFYYEAHDVLEELWLETDGHLHFFYKGLIQLAGAYVHLKKNKLNPAARLFRLALKNLEPHAPETESLDVAALVKRIRAWLAVLEESDYMRSPYDPDHPPQLKLKEG